MSTFLLFILIGAVIGIAVAVLDTTKNTPKFPK